MVRHLTITTKVVCAFLVALLVSGCNDSSSSSTAGASSSSRYVTESFVNDSATRLAEFDIAGPRDPLCQPDAASNLPLPQAYMVYKRDENPTRLVVFAHGINHEVSESWVPHMRREIRIAEFLQNQPGSVAYVSTNYRDNLGFPALRGAHDTIAATLHMLERFPSIETVYLFGVSMGGAVSGTAIAESAALAGGSIFTEDGSPLFDYWLDVEGVSSLVETYSEAAAAAAAISNETAMAAQTGIERDTGGTPVQCPLAYERRSPVFQAALMKQAGLRAATVVHAVNDGLVPHNQGREMAGALTTALIPTQFFTVTRVYEFQDPGSTGTGTLGAGEVDPLLSLAGHASEKDAFHPVMRTAFEQLRKMLDGTYNESVLYFECIVDPDLPPDSCQVDQISP